MSFPKLPWVQRTNVYEVNTRQYTVEGTFNAFREHIPRLKDMGVHTLWFMPVTPISKLKRKGSMGSYYACADYTSISSEFGTMADFKSIVALAHSLDMKVIIDWVANHTGADHTWSQSHPEYYIRNSEGEFYDRHGWDDVIDLDYSNPEMRALMIDAMEFWIRETDIDGFRCDMAMLVPVEFWWEARTALDQVKKLFWLAECDQWNDPQYLEVFDAAYAWKWMHATQEFYKYGKPLHSLTDVLYGYHNLAPVKAIRAWFTSNHDENSWNGTEIEKYGDMAPLLAVFSCTWEGLPLIYSGQEIPNLKRLEFFDKDCLDWGNFPAIHLFYKKLLELKFVHPALQASSDDVVTRFLSTDHADKVVTYQRKYKDREVVVVLNCSPYHLDLQMYDETVRSTLYMNLFQEHEFVFDEHSFLQLDPWAYYIFIT
jgi:alpha-amylase